MADTILIVDDDANIRRLLRLYLEKEGHRTLEAADGEEALRLFAEHAPTLVLLDWMLPGLDGVTVCRRMRESSAVPILMLTARDDTPDKVRGLDSGADDYVTKPCDMIELMARIKAHLRRAHGTAEAEKKIHLPGLMVDIGGYRAAYREAPIDLAPRELELLFMLASHVGQVFTREQLLEALWGYEYIGETRTVDVHIRRLREKLAGSEELGWQIKTVWGVGYRFEVERP